MAKRLTDAEAMSRLLSSPGGSELLEWNLHSNYDYVGEALTVVLLARADAGVPTHIESDQLRQTASELGFFTGRNSVWRNPGNLGCIRWSDVLQPCFREQLADAGNSIELELFLLPPEQDTGSSALILDAMGIQRKYKMGLREPLKALPIPSWVRWHTVPAIPGASQIIHNALAPTLEKLEDLPVRTPVMLQADAEDALQELITTMP